jgi:hypothetical protein
MPADRPLSDFGRSLGEDVQDRMDESHYHCDHKNTGPDQNLLDGSNWLFSVKRRPVRLSIPCACVGLQNLNSIQHTYSQQAYLYDSREYFLYRSHDQLPFRKTVAHTVRFRPPKMDARILPLVP